MENRNKRPITYMLIFSVFLAVAFHLDKLPQFLSYAIGISYPLLIGAIMAFILNVPMHGFEQLLKKDEGRNENRYQSYINNYQCAFSDCAGHCDYGAKSCFQCETNV